MNYRKVSGYAYFDLNLTATEPATSLGGVEYPVGFDFYANKGTIVSVDPCSDEDNAGKNCVTIEEAESSVPFFGSTVNREYVVDGSEMPKKCTLNNDGTRCMDKDCNFHQYKIGFTFEFALLFLMMTICQLFVVTFHFDWQIHDPLIVSR